MEHELYPVESDVPDNVSDYETLSELNDLLSIMRDLDSDITTLDEAIEVSKYVLRYNYRLPYTKYDLNPMGNVEDQVLSWLVDINGELDPITVYDNYVEASDRMENMLSDECVCFVTGCLLIWSGICLSLMSR